MCNTGEENGAAGHAGSVDALQFITFKANHDCNENDDQIILSQE
jgi:hypothetical protein